MKNKTLTESIASGKQRQQLTAKTRVGTGSKAKGVCVRVRACVCACAGVCMLASLLFPLTLSSQPSLLHPSVSRLVRSLKLLVNLLHHKHRKQVREYVCM